MGHAKHVVKDAIRSPEHTPPQVLFCLLVGQGFWRREVLTARWELLPRCQAGAQGSEAAPPGRGASKSRCPGARALPQEQEGTSCAGERKMGLQKRLFHLATGGGSGAGISC